MTTVLVGIWHDRVALLFRDKPVHGWKVELDRAADDISLFEGGQRAMLSAFDAEETDDSPWYIPDFKASREGFARCALTPVKFSFTKDYAQGTLSPNHELPWPHTRDCESYLRAEELMRECVLRRDSAKEYGARVPTPPGYITRALTPEMRIALFS